MRTSALCVAVSFAIPAGLAAGQCYEYGPLDVSPGVDAPAGVYIADATLWDADGPGPLPPVVVICGNFNGAGGVPATRVAAWDGQTWRRLGPYNRLGQDARTVAAGPDGELVVGGSRLISSDGLVRWTGSDWAPITLSGEVNQARYSPRGDLIITGNFSVIADVRARNIARRIEGQWRPISSGLGGPGSCIAAAPDGQIYVGGQFTSAGGVPTRNIARYNGAFWEPLGAGLEGAVYALLPRADGSLFAGGAVTASGATPLANIARWNGNQWQPVGPGLPSPSGGVRALTGASGDVIAAGDFAPSSGPRRVARWNGSAWEDISRGMDSGVRGLLPTPSGTFAVGNFMRADGWPAFKIARWSGDAWTPTSTRPYAPSIDAIASRGNEMYGAGRFYAQGIFSEYRLAVRRGDAWSILSSATNNTITCILPMPDGSIIAGGTFTRAGSVSARRIARWDGQDWAPLGNGTDNTVNHLALLPTGEVIAAGDFTHAGTVTASHIASWNGQDWSAMGAGRPTVTDMAVLPGGDLLTVPGPANLLISRWNGAAWSTLRAPFAPGRLAVDDLGDLYISGLQQGLIARMRAGEWLGSDHSVPGGISALAPFPGGGVLYATNQGLQRSIGPFGVTVNPEGFVGSSPTIAPLEDGRFGVVAFGAYRTLTRDGGQHTDPVFTEQPDGTPILACPGRPVTLRVAAVADGPVTYQWYESTLRELLGAPTSTRDRVTTTAPSGYRGVKFLRCIATGGSCTGAISETFIIASDLPDFNGDGFVDGQDEGAFVDAFESGSTAADFNMDGFVDFLDYRDFIEAFERGC